MEYNRVIQGHAIEVLKIFPDECVDCMITSPPYFQLRSYHTDPIIWPGDKDCEHEWGEEIRTGQTSAQTKYQAAKDAFTQTSVAFCLKCGAVRCELGGEPTPELFVSHLCDIFDEVKRVLKPTGACWINIADSYIDKGFVGIPEMLVIEMKKRKWFRRNTICWHKPNALPSSAEDRFTNDWEYFYFFVKNSKYYFKQQLEAYNGSIDRWGGEGMTANGKSLWDEDTGQPTYRDRSLRPNPKGRNMRCVWSINTEPSRRKHWASFPKRLVQIPIEATCPSDGIVLDPFCGSGTTCRIAYDLGRKYIGIDLSNDFVEISERRLDQKNIFGLIERDK